MHSSFYSTFDIGLMYGSLCYCFRFVYICTALIEVTNSIIAQQPITIECFGRWEVFKSVRMIVSQIN